MAMPIFYIFTDNVLLKTPNHSNRNMNKPTFRCTKSVVLRSAASIMCILTAGIARVSAQDEFARHNFTINAGSSLVKVAVKTGMDATYYRNTHETGTFRSEFTSYPAIQLNYDYATMKWMSVGVALSTQIFDITYKVNEYNQALGEYYIADTYNTHVYRNNIGMRILFHYINNGTVDTYSGLRLGYTFWSPDSGTENAFKGSDLPKTSSIPQVVLFGCRVYFTDNFGANTELCIGPPSYFAAGFNYRF